MESFLFVMGGSENLSGRAENESSRTCLSSTQLVKNWLVSSLTYFFFNSSSVYLKFTNSLALDIEMSKAT